MRIKIPIFSTVSCLFILLAIGLNPAFAQSTFSTLVGTATDQQAAVVAGATVTVTNKGTTATRTATTDNTGNYIVANLDSGEYEVTIEAKGFRKVSFKSVMLRARETVRLDAQLEVAGAVAETVTITAGSGITTEVPTIAVTKSNRELQELPVPFRARVRRITITPCRKRERNTTRSEAAVSQASI